MRRVVASATEISSDLNLVLFDHYGVDRRGAAINFGLVEELPNCGNPTTSAFKQQRLYQLKECLETCQRDNSDF